MAKWIRELNILQEWKKAQEGEITHHEMARVIAEKLNKLRPLSDPFIDERRLELADQFGDMADDEDADVEDFDLYMDDLYDWADMKVSGDFFNAVKVCWVKTF